MEQGAMADRRDFEGRRRGRAGNGRGPWWVWAAVSLFFAGDLLGTERLGQEVSGWLRFEFKEPRERVYYLPEDAECGPDEVREWLPARAGSPDGPRVSLSRSVALLTREPLRIASDDWQIRRRVHERLVILEAPTPFEAASLAEAFCREPGTIACWPVMRRSYRRTNAYAPAPDDPYFAECWHLENRDQSGTRLGIDLNLRGAWPLSRGLGVTVGVVDNAIDRNHPELSGRLVNELHYNFVAKRPGIGIKNESDAHGTAVAGLIAAEGNNRIGVSGVAPEAKLANLVIFELQDDDEEWSIEDEASLDLYRYEWDVVGIQNHSWGIVHNRLEGLNALAEVGIENAIRQGRNGRGTIFVRSSGNGRESLHNANDKELTNDPRAITVAAMRSDGRPASYSTPGACVLVAAPSGDFDRNGLATTDHLGAAGFVARGRGDRENYLLGQDGFSGTSASTAVVSGIVSLLLHANPELSYRDVQQLLVHSAFHPETEDPDLEANGAGFFFSHHTGFGVPDAGFAVRLAREWRPRPEAVQVVRRQNGLRVIPDEGLRLEIQGIGVASALRFPEIRPGTGGFADEAEANGRLIDVGEANDPINIRLDGAVALIKRGTSLFEEKVRHVAEAGAEFAVIYNNRDYDDIVTMQTDFAVIPAVAVSQKDGEALLDLVSRQSGVQARLTQDPLLLDFELSDTLICEQVGVRLDTSHLYRGDLRVTLISPSGTRSVLQSIGNDSESGPVNWTYWSVQHFFEPSAGRWRLTVLDQARHLTGQVRSASLIVRGTRISDADRDGLDDRWERNTFGTLRYGPRDDPDRDGFSNAREQALQTPANRASPPLRLQVDFWNARTLRLSWPAQSGATYEIRRHSPLTGAHEVLETLPGLFPRNEYLRPMIADGEIFTVRER